MDLIDLSPHPDSRRSERGGRDWDDEIHGYNTCPSSLKTRNSEKEDDLADVSWNIDEKPDDEFSLLDGLFESPSASLADPFQLRNDNETAGRVPPWTTMRNNRSETNFFSDLNDHQNTDEYSSGSGGFRSVSDQIAKSKPTLSRRKSNPFYCPSQQIVDMVKKRKKSKTAGVMRSQSSSTIMTLRQTQDLTGGQPYSKADRNGRSNGLQCHDYFTQAHPDAGSSGTRI